MFLIIILQYLIAVLQMNLIKLFMTQIVLKQMCLSVLQFIIPHDDQGAFLDNTDWDVIGGEDVNIHDRNTVVSQGSTDWKGFKIMGDNVNKNIRPLLQQFDNKTNSLHYFHYYALLDQPDLSACSEIVPTDMITLQEILVGVNDVSQLECDLIILISR